MHRRSCENIRGARAPYWTPTRYPEAIKYALTKPSAAGQVGQAFEQAAMTANIVPKALMMPLDRVLKVLQAPQPPLGYLSDYYEPDNGRIGRT